ncbi:hypothetical protein K438DRAFT_648042 [Mycena galopus ATCC 62051]|nr:hypothetical protein K438DRAFT_648042 [Mycena galopus ATCC 62051]
MDQNALEEREIRDLIRQATSNRDKSGALRLKALNKLIDITHTQKTSLKFLQPRTSRNCSMISRRRGGRH